MVRFGDLSALSKFLYEELGGGGSHTQLFSIGKTTVDDQTDESNHDARADSDRHRYLHGDRRHQ